MTRVHGQLASWIHRLRAVPRHATELHSAYTQVIYVWSVQVQVAGGTDQGVAQLQREFFSPDFETQILPVAIFPGYTLIKGWTQTGWDSLPHPSLAWVYRGCGWAWFGTMVRM